MAHHRHTLGLGRRRVIDPRARLQQLPQGGASFDWGQPGRPLLDAVVRQGLVQLQAAALELDADQGMQQGLADGMDQALLVDVAPLEKHAAAEHQQQ